MRNEAAIWSMSFAASVVLRSVRAGVELGAVGRHVRAAVLGHELRLVRELDAGLREEGLHLGDVGREVALGGRGLGAAGLGGRGRGDLVVEGRDLGRVDRAGGRLEAAEAVADGLLGHDDDAQAGDGERRELLLQDELDRVVVDGLDGRDVVLDARAAVRDVRAVRREAELVAEDDVGGLDLGPVVELDALLELERPGQAVLARLRVVRGEVRDALELVVDRVEAVVQQADDPARRQVRVRVREVGRLAVEGELEVGRRGRCRRGRRLAGGRGRGGRGGRRGAAAGRYADGERPEQAETAPSQAHRVPPVSEGRQLLRADLLLAGCRRWPPAAQGAPEPAVTARKTAAHYRSRPSACVKLAGCPHAGVPRRFRVRQDRVRVTSCRPGAVRDPRGARSRGRASARRRRPRSTPSAARSRAAGRR